MLGNLKEDILGTTFYFKKEKNSISVFLPNLIKFLKWVFTSRSTQQSKSVGHMDEDFFKGQLLQH